MGQISYSPWEPTDSLPDRQTNRHSCDLRSAPWSYLQLSQDRAVVLVRRLLLGLQEDDLILLGRETDHEEKWVLPSPPCLKVSLCLKELMRTEIIQFKEPQIP